MTNQRDQDHHKVEQYYCSCSFQHERLLILKDSHWRSLRQQKTVICVQLISGGPSVLRGEFCGDVFHLALLPQQPSFSSLVCHTLRLMMLRDQWVIHPPNRMTFIKSAETFIHYLPLAFVDRIVLLMSFSLLPHKVLHLACNTSTHPAFMLCHSIPCWYNFSTTLLHCSIKCIEVILQIVIMLDIALHLIMQLLHQLWRSVL